MAIRSILTSYRRSTACIAHQKDLPLLHPIRRYCAQAAIQALRLQTHTLKIPAASTEVWTAAASASVKPILSVWFHIVPNPARFVMDRNFSTVDGFQVVGTLKMNSTFALCHDVLDRSGFSLNSICLYNSRK